MKTRKKKVSMNHSKADKSNQGRKQAGKNTRKNESKQTESKPGRMQASKKESKKARM